MTVFHDFLNKYSTPSEESKDFIGTKLLPKYTFKEIQEMNLDASIFKKLINHIYFGDKEILEILSREEIKLVPEAVKDFFAVFVLPKLNFSKIDMLKEQPQYMLVTLLEFMHYEFKDHSEYGVLRWDAKSAQKFCELCKEKFGDFSNWVLANLASDQNVSVFLDFLKQIEEQKFRGRYKEVLSGINDNLLREKNITQEKIKLLDKNWKNYNVFKERLQENLDTLENAIGFSKAILEKFEDLSLEEISQWFGCFEYTINQRQWNHTIQDEITYENKTFRLKVNNLLDLSDKEGDKLEGEAYFNELFDRKSNNNEKEIDNDFLLMHLLLSRIKPRNRASLTNWSAHELCTIMLENYPEPSKGSKNFMLYEVLPQLSINVVEKMGFTPWHFLVLEVYISYDLNLYELVDDYFKFIKCFKNVEFDVGYKKNLKLLHEKLMSRYEKIEKECETLEPAWRNLSKIFDEFFERYPEPSEEAKIAIRDDILPQLSSKAVKEMRFNMDFVLTLLPYVVSKDLPEFMSYFIELEWDDESKEKYKELTSQEFPNKNELPVIKENKEGISKNFPFQYPKLNKEALEKDFKEILDLLEKKLTNLKEDKYKISNNNYGNQPFFGGNNINSVEEKIEKPRLKGKIPGKKDVIEFEEQNTCGIEALGITPEELVNTLIKLKGDEKSRVVLSDEIISAFILDKVPSEALIFPLKKSLEKYKKLQDRVIITLNGFIKEFSLEFSIKNANYFNFYRLFNDIQGWFEQNNLQSKVELLGRVQNQLKEAKSACNKYGQMEEAFEIYINAYRDKKMPLGDTIALFYTKEKGLNLDIWCKEENSDELKLFCSHKINDEGSTIHMLYKDGELYALSPANVEKKVEKTPTLECKN